MAPDLVLPIDDSTRRIERRGDSHDHRRAIGRPGELILACPLNKHRASTSASKQCGVERDIIGAIVPVATCTILVDHLNVSGGNAHDLSDLAAQEMAALR